MLWLIVLWDASLLSALGQVSVDQLHGLLARGKRASTCLCIVPLGKCTHCRDSSRAARWRDIGHFLMVVWRVDQLLKGPNLGQDKEPPLKILVLLRAQVEGATVGQLDRKSPRRFGVGWETAEIFGGGEQFDGGHGCQVQGPFSSHGYRAAR